MKLSKELQKEFREFLNHKEEMKLKKSSKKKIEIEEEEIIPEKKKMKKEKESVKNIEEGYVKRLEKPLKNSEEYTGSGASLKMIYDWLKDNYMGNSESRKHYKTLSIFTVGNRLYSFGKGHVLAEFVRKTGKKKFEILLNTSRPSNHTGLQQSFVKRVISQYEEKGFTVKVKEVQHI